MSSAAHTLTQISPHVHWLSPDGTTDRPVLGVIAGTRHTLIVDTGNSPAHARILLDAMDAAGIAPPSYVALTHWHWDHVFGTAVFDLPTFGHVETQRVVTEMAGQDWSDAALDARVASGVEIAFCRDMIKAELPDRSGLVLRPPDIAFTGEVTLDLGGVTCRLVHVGGDHASDAVVVYVPQDQVVFLGDSPYQDIYTPERRYTTAKFFPLAECLLGFDAEWYLWGHDDEPMSRAAMTDDLHILTTIGRLVAEHGDRDTVLAHLAATFPDPLDEYYLGSVDAFLVGSR